MPEYIMKHPVYAVFLISQLQTFQFACHPCIVICKFIPSIHMCLQMQTCVNWAVILYLSSNMWVVAFGDRGNCLTLLVEWRARGRTVVFTRMEC